MVFQYILMTNKNLAELSGYELVTYIESKVSFNPWVFTNSSEEDAVLSRLKSTCPECSYNIDNLGLHKDDCSVGPVQIRFSLVHANYNLLLELAQLVELQVKNFNERYELEGKDV